MPLPTLDRQVAAVRRFNRFYTREMGVLRKTFLDTPWTLGEMRVLYEIAMDKGVLARDVAMRLGLDPAYVSRLLKAFERDGLVARVPAPHDARKMVLALTPQGRKLFQAANNKQAGLVSAMLKRLTPTERVRLTEAMGVIESLMDPERASRERVLVLRAPRPGDFGWMVTLNAEVYSQEYGWEGPFEGLCARIVADFAEDHDPARERCWIADVDGQRAGSIMLLQDRESSDRSIARIRLLVLDPTARGLGLGRKLVEESIAFARSAGYLRIVLWTHAVLTAARAIYVKSGFVKTGEEIHDSWGREETSEFYELDLRRA